MSCLAVMVSLGMVAVYLLSRLPNLFDDEEAAFGLDNPFDLRLLMSGEDDEVVALLHNGRVAAGRNLDRLDAATSAALAVKWQGCRDLVLLGALLDPLVYLAEDLLVSRCSFSEVHGQNPALGVARVNASFAPQSSKQTSAADRPSVTQVLNDLRMTSSVP
jgi:hypothetical protein